MLSFDIRSLDSHAAIVDEQLSANDAVWEENDPKLIGAIHVTGRLSVAGPGRYYWHGRIEGDVSLECSRCLADTRARVNEEMHTIFAESEDSGDLDDPDVYRLDAGAQDIDLREAIREEWLVSAPSFALCREECKGFCPRCGADLNAEPHDCEHQESDARWDALRKLDKSSE